MHDREIVYDDFVEGQAFPPYDFTVSAEDVAMLAGALDMGPLRRADGSVVEGEAGDQGVSLFLLNTFQVQRNAFRMPDGILHARETLVSHGPARAGEPLRMTIQVKSKYERNGRLFIVLDLELSRRADQARILTVERTLCWPR